MDEFYFFSAFKFLCCNTSVFIFLKFGRKREQRLQIESSKTNTGVHRHKIIHSGFPDSSVGKESTCNVGDSGSILGSGRFAAEGIVYPLRHYWASLGAQLVEKPPACRRPGFNPWVGKIPWRRERLLSLLVFWSGEFHGPYSPWGR